MKIGQNTNDYLGFKLTSEAAKRINERIEKCDLQILRDYKNLPKEDRVYTILEYTQDILRGKRESTDGCKNKDTVTSWLDMSRFKTFHIFEALCESVEEHWYDVFDRTYVYEKLMSENRRELVNELKDSLLNEFIYSDAEQNYLKAKNLDLLRDITGSERVDAMQLTELVRVLLKDFARNGRQIRFGIDNYSELYNITAITITGSNQNDEIETWVCEYRKPYPKKIEIANWWWKGTISIQFQVLKGREQISYSGSILIPPQGYIAILFEFQFF